MFRYQTGWIFIFYILRAASSAEQLNADPVDASSPEVSLLPGARFIPYPKTEPEITDLQKLPADQVGDIQNIISFGFSSAVYLFLIPINNPGKETLSRHLVFNPTWLDHVQATLIRPSGEKITFRGGDRLPYSHRSMVHRNINFEITLDPGVTWLLVRTQTEDPYLVQMTLWERSAFYENEATQKLYLGFVYGVLLAMLLYNLVLFVSIKEMVYAAYVNYILFFILMHSTYNGHLYGLLWPDYPLWSNWAHSIFIYLFILSGVFFLVSFLELRNRLKKHFHIAAVFGTVIFASFVLTAIGGYKMHVITSILWIFVYTPFVLFIGFASLMAGNKAARYFLTAAVAGFIGSFITAGTVTGIFPFVFYTYHAVDFGMLLDAVLLSLAMADRLRLAREDADRARVKLLELTKSQAKNLKKEIALRTIELEDLNRQLMDLSMLDPLTGIGNRRKFNETIEKEWFSHMRTKRPLSLLICDVDFFKQYNDHYGHLEGDQCLKLIATTIHNVVTRPSDMISRFGGEEFAVLLPETDTAGAYHVADQIRFYVQSLKIKHHYSSVSEYVTISVGFAGLIPSESRSIESFIQIADKALYQAKESGRNKVMGPEDFYN